MVVSGSIAGKNGTTIIGDVMEMTGSLTVTSNAAINGGALTSTAATFNLLDSGQTTLNVGRSATNINLGTTTSGITATVGNINGTSALTLQAGTGNMLLTGSTTTTYTIGGETGTGTITLGRSAASNTINIGTGTSQSSQTQTINLGTNATGTGKAAVTIGNTNGASSIVLNTGAGNTLTLGGSLSTGSVAGSLEVTGNSVFGTVIESMLNNNNSTGVTAFSLANQSIFYVNNPAGNITANFTNAQTTNNRIISTTVILSQSVTPRIVSAVQIDGVASTINWSNNVTPTGNANKQDIFGFSLIRSGSAWKTLGQMTTYG